MSDNLSRNRLVLVSIIVLSALVLIILLRGDRGPKLNLDPFTVAGEVIAEETSSLLDGRGKILVVTLDTSATEMPATTAVLKAFQKRMKGQEGITITSVEALKVNPSPGMPLWSLSQYKELVGRHAGVDAIVSFLGPPFFTEAEMSQLPAELPKGLVFGGGTPGQPLRKLFERGVIQVAVVNRFTPPQPGPALATGTAQEQFEQQFQIVRTENAPTLPY